MTRTPCSAAGEAMESMGGGARGRKSLKQQDAIANRHGSGCACYHQAPMKLDPVSLRLFVAVMEESTIAAAAAREHLAASAVSRRLADLEDALHVALFTR
eukprot:gene44052-58744_t